MTPKETKLVNQAVQSLINICSSANATEEDRDYDTGKLLPNFRKAYTILTKLERAGLVKFEEPGVYAKILNREA